VARIHTILLDMDGVCCDFVSAACDVNGKKLEDLMPLWPAGSGWNFFELWGTTAEEFWSNINHSAFFWSCLDEYDWYLVLVDLVKSFPAEMVFSSSPSKCPTSHSGKATWLRDQGFCPSKDAMLGSRKYLMANPGTILIDDSDKNCEDFRARGGHAIVFPQHWNSQHEKQDIRLAYVQEQLKRLFEE
jgi:5'(3')-deoxyribonucleotidase